ncbi:hypothetical protein BH11BAC5_BH11BAC5_54780 [soil metagenome]
MMENELTEGILKCAFKPQRCRSSGTEEKELPYPVLNKR